MELDVSHGILPEIEIDCNSVVITQKLDYLRMPFRCSYCHETGHLRKSCSFLLQGIPLSVGFADTDPSLECSPSPTLQQHSSQDSQSLIDASTDFPTPPTMFGPYDSSFPTSVGDLTKEELLFIKDVETMALSSSRSRNELVVDPLSPSHTPLLVVSPPPPFNLENFPPLTHSTSPPCMAPPGSPLTTPSFDDPTLLKALDIFTDKSPISPSVLPLDSIRFENVTIRKAK